MKIGRVREYNAKSSILGIHVIISRILTLCEPLKFGPLIVMKVDYKGVQDPKTLLKKEIVEQVDMSFSKSYDPLLLEAGADERPGQPADGTAVDRNE